MSFFRKINKIESYTKVAFEEVSTLLSEIKDYKEWNVFLESYYIPFVKTNVQRIAKAGISQLDVDKLISMKERLEYVIENCQDLKKECIQ